MPASKFTLTSPAFEAGKAIPTKYAYRGVTGGQNISIPFTWTQPPAQTQSLALTIIDLHPIANNWVHWLVINIPPGVLEIPEGASGTSRMPTGCIELVNSYGDKGYGGPQPPKGTGRHIYECTLYALDVEKLVLSVSASLGSFMREINGRVIQNSRLQGFFER